jgi:hypothetical protein
MMNIKDRNGNEVNVGDYVYIPCVVTDIFNKDLRLETVEKNNDEIKTIIHVDGKQVERK